MVTLRVPSVPRSKPARSPLWPQREVHFWIPISVSYKLSSDMDRSSELTRILIYWFLLQEYSALAIQNSYLMQEFVITINSKTVFAASWLRYLHRTWSIASQLTQTAVAVIIHGFPTNESDKHHDGDCTNPWSNRPNFSLLFRSNKN